ncbi:DUF4358 domain-containing protein [Dysosmobacter sp.]
MKKWMTLTLLALLSAALLSACGGKDETATPDVDLTDFYEDVKEEYGWSDGYMTDIEGELLESYYPGLGDISLKQLVAKAPMMSAVVNEMVFLQAETEEDAAAAAAILQDRIDLQAQGGAWYPESMEAWGRGIVIQQGAYVCMVASAEHQDEISEGFNNLFL